MSGRAILGSEGTGVEGELDNKELLDDDDKRRSNKIEVKDDVREVDEKDGEGEGASEIAGLKPR